MKFKNLEFFALGFIPLIILGFWPTYFSKFLDGTANFNHYFHFHAATAILWVILLITQPLLLRLKQRELHRLVGKTSYVLVPVLFLSVLLLAHSRSNPDTEGLATRLWVPFKDLFIFSFGYGVAILKRKDTQVHARGMIVAGMTLIPPTTVRLMVNFLGIERPLGFFLGLAPLYLLLITLIIVERKSKKGRWVFPCALCLFLFVHTVQVAKINLPFWDSFARWFISLPLT